MCICAWIQTVVIYVCVNPTWKTLCILQSVDLIERYFCHTIAYICPCRLNYRLVFLFRPFGTNLCWITDSKPQQTQSITLCSKRKYCKTTFVSPLYYFILFFTVKDKSSQRNALSIISLYHLVKLMIFCKNTLKDFEKGGDKFAI